MSDASDSDPAVQKSAQKTDKKRSVPKPKRAPKNGVSKAKPGAAVLESDLKPEGSAQAQPKDSQTKGADTALEPEEKPTAAKPASADKPKKSTPPTSGPAPEKAPTPIPEAPASAPDLLLELPESTDIDALLNEASKPAGGADRSKSSGSGNVGLELGPNHLVLVAVRGMVLFPGVVLPVVASRARSIKAIQAAVQMERPIGLLLQKDSDDNDPDPEDLHRVGTVAEIMRYVTAPDGSHHVIVQGQERFKIKRFVRTEPYLVGEFQRLPETALPRDKKKIEARALHLKHQASQALSLLPEPPEELNTAVQNSNSPSALTDLIATFMELPASEKQDLLETLALPDRMEKVSAKLAHLIEVLSLSKELRQRTRGTMEKAQREYFLREQLKTIQAELGEGGAPELQDLAKKIAEAGLPPEVEKEVRKELARLERMPDQAAEYGMLRSYLELIVELPWSKHSTDAIDLLNAQSILDEDHFGLEKIKQRILEFLAVRKLKPDGKSPILCFVGPPGVGKTSLGMSIARAMGRQFVRISLGGVHDESEIRGHRRTYVGAMPGSIIQGMRRAGTGNPVFMLDEMDKLGTSYQGDPSSALLEVLDPAQNNSFRDHYLGVPYDLSRVMFVATANVLDQIPRPLRDRCEVIELNGYTEEEKLEIAQRYLIKRQRDENGLSERNFALETRALREIIRSYTREAGVRELERQIGSVARRAATQVASGKKRKVSIRARDIETILGPPRYENELRTRTSVPGVATGLAWTPAGGDILFIEATRMPGKGELILTGQLGDVMKESARAAVSVLKARAHKLEIPNEALTNVDIHIHLPAGAIPKDGPSAGVALFTALVSLFTKRTVSSTLAMTGEISLRGLVLPVGGIKEKVLAAYRAGIQTVILPRRNQRDWEDVPPAARNKLKVVFVDDVSEVLEHAFAPKRSALRSPGAERTKEPRAAKRRPW